MSRPGRPARLTRILPHPRGPGAGRVAAAARPEPRVTLGAAAARPGRARCSDGVRGPTTPLVSARRAAPSAPRRVRLQKTRRGRGSARGRIRPGLDPRSPRCASQVRGRVRGRAPEPARLRRPQPAQESDGMFHADLHIHSRYSRACSKDCDIEHLAWWALRKGITVVGTGDFTHPAWAADLRESLIPAEPGLLRLRPELEARLRRTSPPNCAGQVRFMLSSEISTIYRGGDRTRKVHHLIYAPTFEAADRITEALAKIGNLASDGRPILGLPSRDLLEITLAGGPGCYLVPAHAWTPWFAVLGSKSGFDLVADCYGDLAGEVFAIETGLSSDPAMNWRCSALDGYRLVSNSDAHSPPMLGREATTLSCDLDYFAMARAFRTGDGLAGTLEFFPEEGKYHLDGHRKCGIRLDPEDSRARDGICPQGGKPLPIGVPHRVAELADRAAGYRPPGAPGFTSLVQLRQIVGEIVATGPASREGAAEGRPLIGILGP